MKRLVSLILLALPGLTAAGVPREVLSFYYGWYGNPQTSQRWVHWKDVDEAKKQIGGSTNYPKLGPYDCHDPKVVDQHFRWAKRAGITGFIVTWWRQGDFHDQGLPLILDTAGKHGLRITIYFETAPTPESSSTAARSGRSSWMAGRR